MSAHGWFLIGAGVVASLMAITPIWLILTGDGFAAALIGIPSAIVLFAMFGLAYRLAEN
jgi:hypothetical protein